MTHKEYLEKKAAVKAYEKAEEKMKKIVRVLKMAEKIEASGFEKGSLKVVAAFDFDEESIVLGGCDDDFHALIQLLCSMRMRALKELEKDYE